mgnify:CR=1 FL=1
MPKSLLYPVFLKNFCLNRLVIQIVEIVLQFVVGKFAVSQVVVEAVGVADDV